MYEHVHIINAMTTSMLWKLNSALLLVRTYHPDILGRVNSANLISYYL